MRLVLLSFILIFGFLHADVNGQLTINEYSASNLETYLDNHNRTEDWIELHNSSSSPIDLAGYHLSDKESKPMKWEIPVGVVIPAGGFVTFWCSGRDTIEGDHFHTNFKLSQTAQKDQIVLANPSGQIIESTNMTITLTEHSICKDMDGSGQWMVCRNTTLNASNNGVVKYKNYTQTPTIDKAAGFYLDSVIVSITNNEPNSILRYTTNGKRPTIVSSAYEGPIKIDSTTVVKAMSFSTDPEVLLGKMDFATFFINEDFSVAVFSVAADDVQQLANGSGEIIPIGSIEYFNKNKEREATSYGSLNRHGQDSWVLDHRSIDWVSRDEMGYSKAVEAPLFAYSKRDSYQKFMFRNSGDDNYPSLTNGQRDDAHEGSTHIRDEYVQTLSQEGGMKVDFRAVERVVVFLNGDYWGLYGMRERPVDHDYTDEYYNQGKYDLHFLSTWGRTQAQYGERAAFEDWFQLRDFILGNDMSMDSNYRKVDDELNTTSLIDYMVANLNVVAVDWLNYNTGWWKGLNPEGDHKKWGYILWDLDATFDYYINYTGVPNQNPDADPCDIEDISESMDQFFEDLNPAQCNTIMNGSCPYLPEDTIFQAVIDQNGFCCWGQNWGNFCQNAYDEILENGIPEETGWVDIRGNVGKHEKIFIKLIEESPEFKQLYYSRYADLMNTVYSCENMITTLDRMVAVIDPEMPRQIERWGGTYEEWLENVDDLRDYVLERCELLDDGLVECYEVTGAYDVTFMTSPQGAGEIRLNTLKYEENLPWTGAYFGGMDNIVKARALQKDMQFSHWESKSGQIILADQNERETTFQLMESDTLVAVFSTLTGTSNIEDRLALMIYPNPTPGFVKISFDLEKPADVAVSLLNVMGQRITNIQSFEKRSEGEQNLNFDLSSLNIPYGIYLVQIQVDHEKVNKRIAYLND